MIGFAYLLNQETGAIISRLALTWRDCLLRLAYRTIMIHIEPAAAVLANDRRRWMIIWTATRLRGCGTVVFHVLSEINYNSIGEPQLQGSSLWHERSINALRVTTMHTGLDHDRLTGLIVLARAYIIGRRWARLRRRYQNNRFDLPNSFNRASFSSQPSAVAPLINMTSSPTRNQRLNKRPICSLVGRCKTGAPTTRAPLRWGPIKRVPLSLSRHCKKRIHRTWDADDVAAAAAHDDDTNRESCNCSGKKNGEAFALRQQQPYHRLSVAACRWWGTFKQRSTCHPTHTHPI